MLYSLPGNFCWKGGAFSVSNPSPQPKGQQTINYYQGNDDLLRDELLCFTVLLHRAKRLPQIELEHIMERVRMFDPLLEEDPWVLQVKARVEKESLARGRAEGRAEGALSTSRKFFVKIVNKCFPSLVTLAEIRALQIEKP